MIWVVGGTSGIGLATSKLLTTMGHNVLRSGVDEADVRNKDSLFTFLAKQVPATKPDKIDMLVYSAGINYLEWLDEIHADDMLDMYHVNVVGLINVLQLCAPKRVVVVGSDAAWREMRTSIAYCASKAALHQAVRCIARERASENFAINVVAPGMTEPTRMQEYVDLRVPVIRGWTEEDARAYEKSQIPMGRRADRNEVAQVIVTTLLMPTPYLNGAIIPVNGGR